jgi:hypothetical protein
MYAWPSAVSVPSPGTSTGRRPAGSRLPAGTSERSTGALGSATRFRPGYGLSSPGRGGSRQSVGRGRHRGRARPKPTPKCGRSPARSACRHVLCSMPVPLYSFAKAVLSKAHDHQFAVVRSAVPRPAAERRTPDSRHEGSHGPPQRAPGGPRGHSCRVGRIGKTNTIGGGSAATSEKESQPCALWISA